MKTNLIPIFFCALLGTFSMANAQVEVQDTLAELSPVSIIGKNTDQLTGSGELITAKTLAKLNQPDVNKVLRTVPGVNIRDEEGFGLRPNIGLRGTPVNRSAKITVMEDGILMAPAPYADPSAYYFPTFARIQGVEVLKGSSQIQYGPYTIGGALNLLSTAIPESFKGFAQLSYGSFGTNQQRLWVGDSKKHIDYVFELNRWASNGFKQLDNGGNTGFDRRDLMGKVRWHTAADAKIQQSVTLKVVNMTEDGNESYLGLSYEDFVANPNRRYAATQKDVLNMRHQHYALTHQIKPFKGFELNTTAYYTNTFRDWARVNSVMGKSLMDIIANPAANDTAYQVMTGKMNGNVAYQSAARTFMARGLQTQLNYSLQTGAIKHKIHAGVRYHEDEADRYATQSTFAMTNGSMVLTSAGVFGNRENQIRSASSLAAHLQYELSYKNLTIVPGLRYENVRLDFQNYGNNDYARLGTDLKTAQNQVAIWLPGVGANYAIGSHMHIFGGVHKGFSPPGTPSTTSDQQSKSETALNYELGYRYHARGIHAQIVGFLNDYANILGSDNVSGGGAGTGDMFNAGRAKVQGLELSAGYNVLAEIDKTWKYRLPLSIAYTYTNAKFMDNFKNAGGDWGSGDIQKGDLIPFITPQLFTGSIGFETDKLNLTLLSRFVGNTRTTPGQDAEIVPAATVKYSDVNTIGKYWVFDFSANYRFHKQITAFCMINNLFNNSYIVANLPQGYRPGMPFGANLGLKAEF